MRVILMAAVALAGIVAGMPAHAQTTVEGRVDRLEREMRAVQRKVFPGGAEQYFEPQITPQQAPQTAPGVPATNPVTDLTQRVNALESQLTTLTGQVEQSQYRVRQLEDAFNAYKRATDARIKLVESGAGTGSGTTAEDAPAPATRGPGRGGGVLALPGEDAAKPTPKPAAGTAASGIEKPETGDAGEDAYIYGYRLWAAKQYPQAIDQLKAMVAKYPKHRRASFAQNLLGRAYLDAGQPADAAIAFYNNFKKMPEGERAPDSLYYLAQSLIKLKKPMTEVCTVYDELTQAYGDRISESMKADVAAGRTQAKCK